MVVFTEKTAKFENVMEMWQSCVNHEDDEANIDLDLFLW
jgi:hypothetical protein